MLSKIAGKPTQAFRQIFFEPRKRAHAPWLAAGRLQSASGSMRFLIMMLPFFLSVSTWPWIFGTSALADMTRTLTPRISVDQQYDDNIDLTSTNEDSDWITLVSPGLSLELESLQTTLSLDYEAGFSFYRDDSSRNSTRHAVGFSWDQGLARHLSLHVSDDFLRSEDPIEETEGMIQDIHRRREVYYHNTAEVSLSLDFGTEDQITMGYRDRYLDDRSADNEDSGGHEAFLNLDKWFGPRYGIGITSYYENGDFEQSDDFDEYGAGLTLNYRWAPSRRLYVRYDYTNHDFEEPATATERNDSQVHNTVLGVSLSLAPHTALDLEAGYFLQNYENSGQTDGVSYSGTFTTSTQQTTLSLSGSGGYDEDYYSDENLGSSKFHQVAVSGNHQLTEALGLFLSSSYRWEEYFGEDAVRDRKDEIFRAAGGLSFSFWRRFALSLEGIHSERDSDDPDREFDDNRIMLRLSATYPVRL